MYNSPRNSVVNFELSAFVPYLDGVHYRLPEVVTSDIGPFVVVDRDYNDKIYCILF
jgi:hypothetical protein